MIAYKKRAFITGIAGQDGSYLAELLVKKGYKVFGLVRSFKKDSLQNIEKLYKNKKIILIKGDLGVLESLKKGLKIAQPDEIYNFAAQSDEVRSFKLSKETYNINYRGFGYLVDVAIKINPKVKIFQAGSSRMFDAVKSFQNEKTSFGPVSPYGKAKLKAHIKYVVEYRKKYDFFICSGILFNHISPRCSESFIARKITGSMVKIKLGSLESLKLGNINVKRDWGYAPEYMEAAWKMLQQKTPQDFVIATGETHSVREFIEEACKVLDIDITWKGKGLNEKGIDKKTGKTIVEIDPQYFRPNEVSYLCGDSRKARKILNWKPKTSFKDLVKIMVEADSKREKILNNKFL